VSPENSLVNAESPANRVKYLDPPFDSDGNPRYDLDDEGNVQMYLKPGYFERWINTQNMDYAGNKQNVMVYTPSGNYQNTNISAGVISFDEGRTATPLAVPAGVAGQGPTAQNNAGWIAVDAAAQTVVWSVSGQTIANTYWTDVSLGADSAAVGSHEGRPQGSSEVRQVVKYGDRAAWTKSEFYNAAGTLVTAGNVKVFSDKVQQGVFYGFTGTTLYVSTDGGRRFDAVTVSGAGIPNANWNTNGHGQGANKIQVDVYGARSIWLASNAAAAGLVHVTYDAASSSWVSTKVNPGTTSAFQQVGMGLGLGDNSTPALYAMGVISDNTGYPAKAARYGVYRSLDGGGHWSRINDDQHQFGDLRALSGDSRVFGRVYLGTGTRGIRVGETAWDVQYGSDDRTTRSTLVVTAGKGAIAAGQPLGLSAELFDPWGQSQGDVTADTAFTTTVEGSVVDGAPANPFVSLTYVIRGTYTWSDGLGEHSVTSEPVRVQVYNVDALVPVVTGTAAVGETLHAEVPAGWAVSFAWLRGGTVVGTGPAYTVTTDDAGAELAVRASVDALDGATRTSAPVAVPRLVPDVTLTLGASSVTTVDQASADVNVSAPELEDVAGQVTVSVAGQHVTAALADGAAHVTLPRLPAGTHEVTATFAGNDQVGAGDSAAAALAVSKVVPTVAVTLGATSITTAVAGKATVSVSAPGVPEPTGTVTVRYGSKSVAATLKVGQHGKAAVTLPKLAAGSYAVSASYGGDAVVAGATSATSTLKVVKVVPKVAVKLAATSIKANQAAKVTVTVAAPGVAEPTGTVTVRYGKKTVAATLKAGQHGKVTVTLPKVAAGSYAVSASYGGDAVVAGATSATTTLKVAKVKPTVKAKLASTKVKHGSSAKLIVTVSASGTPSPTGKVTVKYGTRSQTVTLSAAAKGKVTVTLKAPKAGTFTVRVTYAGNGYLSSRAASGLSLKVT
ncbi:MAG TPA: Ig-like domain-containing protein, partial [Cellulomonas sp.]|nr:Ig-like domain-containing protein [Cellulomonas sp.]